MELRRRSVAKGVPILIAGIAVLAAVAIYVILNPEILGSMLHIAVIVGVIIIAAVLVIIAVTAILAVPIYIYKGEVYQEGSYELKDIKPAGERGIEDRKEE